MAGPRLTFADAALTIAIAMVLGFAVGVLHAGGVVAGLTVGASTVALFRFVLRSITPRK